MNYVRGYTHSFFRVMTKAKLKTSSACAPAVHIFTPEQPMHKQMVSVPQRGYLRGARENDVPFPPRALFRTRGGRRGGKGVTFA